MKSLETARLLLRPWQDGDAPVLYRWASDLEVGPRAGWPVHTSVENSLEIIHGPLGQPETYALVYKQTGEPVGSVGLFPPEPPLDLPAGAVQLELGYWVARPYWGQGLAPEAGRAMIHRAFENLGCTVVHCSHADFNSQSRRVIEKLGFTYRLTRDAVDGDGNPRPTCCYVLTRENWERQH